MWHFKNLVDLGAVITMALALGFSPGVNAANPPQPTYQPLYTADFEGGAVGNTVQELSVATTPAKTTYSNSIAGPFGGARVVKQTNTVGAKFFGGSLTNFTPNLDVGDEVWVRWYEYFPDNGSTFMWANGDNVDGGSGAIKWMRFEYTNKARMTLEMNANPNCALPCASGKTDLRPKYVIGENMGWLLYEGRHNPVQAYMADYSAPAPSFSRGQWHAIQVYMRLSKGDIAHGDGNGLIRVWVDNTLTGEFNRNTLPPVGHSSEGATIRSVWWGNYWNGGFPANQSWFLDEVIVTTDRPNTTDSGGRPFIHPQTRVADFGSGSSSNLPAPPNPPSSIQ
jgi:hypothetical protein